MNITWDGFEHLCITIAVVGAAIAYIYKAVRFAKKPADVLEKRLDHIEDCLDRDNKRIRLLEDSNETLMEFLTLIVKSTELELEHMETNNATGKLGSMRKELSEFLVSKSLNK